MPDPRLKTCRNCGKHTDEVGPISWSRLCSRCAHDRQAENITGLATMSNPARDRWRRGMAASVGAVLLDDAQRSA